MSFNIDHSQVRSDDGLYAGEEICAKLGEDDVQSMNLNIDHSQVRSDDGLYAGEEICAMLGENDGIVGIEQVGVEMELDEADISISMDISDESSSTREDEEAGKDEQRDDDEAVIPQPVTPVIPVTHCTHVPGQLRAIDCTAAAIIPVGRAVGSSIGSQRPVGGKLHIMRRQLLTKATSKIKSIVKRGSFVQQVGQLDFQQGPCSSPRAKRALRAVPSAERAEVVPPGDDSTCDMTHASNSASTIASGRDANSPPTLGYTPSSITASTCDFAPDVNDHAVFENYLVTNPWEAAKRGDYATLSYIANHDDANIWTQEDEAGHVPLYYACTSYSQSGDGTSFGKYGLESIRLLIRLWPPGVELPRALLEQCRNSSRNIGGGDAMAGGSVASPATVHKDVLELLTRGKKGKGQLRTPLALFRAQLSEITEEDWKLEGVSDIVPVSFLEDLGDDGYVEDY